ncbi:helix-turn-helix domain-containing protein [Actinomadura rugatobispora]|uniref:Helix-turn-helix domain-containing protein n=1 Tax=Actinomadura rugatobispora TaxID=1994 RepID=A0ABW1ABS0_9ACTN|nr:helix-turn-helix domain-containing protein [Actinomadura rugatobispora]
MSKGRLTFEERERIAQGLTEGLGFAEISRRLGRPTSTISREVNRNGGAGAYRPDQAHEATRERARRQRVKAVEPPQQPPAAGTRKAEDKLTDVLVASGLTRMSSRVLACLCTTHSGGLTAADLVQRLQVSPASISKAVAELEAMNLIGREREKRRRRDRYIVDKEIWYRSLLASARFNTNIAEVARQNAEALGHSTPAGARMDAMSGFFEQVGRETVAVAQRYRHILTR